VRGKLFAQNVSDDAQDALSVRHDVGVPESEDVVSSFFKRSIPQTVALAFRVLTTINLDDELFLTANKVDNEIVDCLLSHELEAIEAPVAQRQPQPYLSVS
jgi:hypothetical protein